MEQTEVHDHRIEAGRVEWQRLRVALAKRDRRMPPRRLGNHRRREVEADHIGAASGRGGGDRTRAGRDVEHAAAGDTAAASSSGPAVCRVSAPNASS